jgi:NAD(P)-dependent dehydrogenase (short-subunit alcohol dehydrogenase family)
MAHAIDATFAPAHKEIAERTYAKVTRRLVPFLFICYFAAYLDRVNVGFAKLQMLNELKFSETIYRLGAGIFFLGYVLFEVPSNIIMHKVGARLWIARIMIWDRIFDTNARGAFVVARAAARRMVEERLGGSIINIASILGLRVAGQVAPYAASKAALVHLTRALALEWARHNIRVNAIAPGYIETDFNRDFFESEAGRALVRRVPQRRLGRAEELDGPLLLLASDASSYMTGSTVTVDGRHLQSTL